MPSSCECASGRTHRFGKAPLIHCQISVKRAGPLSQRADSHRRVGSISMRSYLVGDVKTIEYKRLNSKNLLACSIFALELRREAKSRSAYPKKCFFFGSILPPTDSGK